MCKFQFTLLREQTCSCVSSPDTTQIGDGTLRGVADKFLGVGETVFDMIQATAVNSSYFRKDSRK